MATKIQVDRINKLVDFLENVVHKSKFNLNHWVGQQNEWPEFPHPDPRAMKKRPSEVGSCNTSACVVGWLPHLFPRLVKWEIRMNSWISYGNSGETEEELFSNVTGISIEGSEKIIYAACYRSDNPKSNTVAKQIRKIASKEGILLTR